MRLFALFFWIFFAIECSSGHETTESPIEVFETINNGHMNPDSLEIFTTEKNQLFDVIIEENARVTTDDLIETTQNADSVNNSIQENPTNLFSDPEPTKLKQVTDKTPKNLIGLDLIDYNFASDEMFNKISDLTATASENQETVTEINIKESINGRTIQRKPTEEELKYIQNHSNEIIEDLDELLKSDTSGLNEDDLFGTFDEDDEVDTMFKRSKDPAGDFRKFFHSERRNFSDANEVNITINEAEGDSFDDDPTINKFDYIEKLMNNKDDIFTTTEIQVTTILSKAENDTIEAVETTTRILNVQNTQNDTLTEIEVSTESDQSIEAPVESTTAVDIKNAETSTRDNTAELVAVNIGDSHSKEESVENATQSAAEDEKILTTVEAETIEASTDTVEISSKTADKETVTDASNTEISAENDTVPVTVTLPPYVEVSTDTIETSTESATARGVENAENSIENDAVTMLSNIETFSEIIDKETLSQNTANDTEEPVTATATIEVLTEAAQPTDFSITLDAQKAETSTVNNASVTLLTEIDAITEPQDVKTSTQITKTDNDGENLAENGVSIQDFNDITNLVATSLNEIKNSEEAIDDIEATFETITDEASAATIPVDTSTVKINIEGSTTPLIADVITEEALSESTDQFSVSTTSVALTTKAASNNIIEQGKAYIQDYTTNLPQMESTTTNDISSTIIQESHSFPNEMSSEIYDAATESVNLNSSTDNSQETATIFVEQVFETATIPTATAATHKDELESALKAFFLEPSPSEVESMFNAKLEEQESLEDDSLFGNTPEEQDVDHFEGPDFLGSIGADGKTVQMVPLLRTKILENVAEFSVKISKKGDNIYIPAFAFIKEYDNIVNITWNTDEGGNNSLALKVTNNEKFYVIKEVVLNVFRGNKFNIQKKAVALTPDPDMDDTMPGRTRTVAMRDGTFITFSNVEFLKKSEISEAATEGQKMWHFEVASVSLAVIAIIAVLIYYIAVKTRAKIVLREKDELRQVTHC